jgi:hypothetical protein
LFPHGGRAGKLQNLSSLGFGGADLRTAYFGVLLADDGLPGEALRRPGTAKTPSIAWGS